MWSILARRRRTEIRERVVQEGRKDFLRERKRDLVPKKRRGKRDSRNVKTEGNYTFPFGTWPDNSLKRKKKENKLERGKN